MLTVLIRLSVTYSKLGKVLRFSIGVHCSAKKELKRVAFSSGSVKKVPCLRIGGIRGILFFPKNLLIIDPSEGFFPSMSYMHEILHIDGVLYAELKKYQLTKIFGPNTPVRSPTV